MTITKNHAILKQEVAAHVAADQVLQGRYWDGDRGCFIGCLTHSSSPTPAVERFGLTLPILRIAESIFEGLPPKDAKDFFAALPDAVACDGKDLSLVHWAFLAEELRELPKQFDDTERAIDLAIAGMDLLASGQEWPDAADAAEAAYSHTARSAAYAATTHVYSTSRDVLAEVATHVADATCYAACSSTGAYSVIRIRQRDTLLRLIKEAPVKEGGK